MNRNLMQILEWCMPNKTFSKNTNQLCSVWKMIWIMPCSILKKLNIIWNLMILKEHLIYNKSDRKIIASMSSDVVNDAFLTINERIQKEKEENEREEEKETRRMLEEVLKVMKTLQR